MNKVTRVIIAGSRDFDDYGRLERVCDNLLSRLKDIEPIEIVSGTARGADTLAIRYAKEKGFALKLMPADWGQFGASAGYIRNTEMATYAQNLIVFWDSKSRGTKHMINIAKNKGLRIHVEHY